MTKAEKAGQAIGILEVYTAGIWAVCFAFLFLGLFIGQGLCFTTLFLYGFSFIFFSVPLAVFGIIGIVKKRSAASVTAIVLLSLIIIENAFVIGEIAPFFTPYSVIGILIATLGLICATAAIIVIADSLSETKRIPEHVTDHQSA